MHLYYIRKKIFSLKPVYFFTFFAIVYCEIMFVHEGRIFAYIEQGIMCKFKTVLIKLTEIL